MKNITKTLTLFSGIILLGYLSACNNFLEITPPSNIIAEKYLSEESQLEAYANKLYSEFLPSHGNWSYGTFGVDAYTDNQIYRSFELSKISKYVPGQWKTGSGGGSWWFDNIYKCNYFLDIVKPRYKAGTIAGNKEYINHYMGEIYFFRAHEYFNRYQALGDFPIIRHNMPDNMEILTAASKRAPRNEVARLIISDLDSAIMLMEKSPNSKKTRVSKNVALLLKSRVALYEGTWLKYFKGTAFVPNGTGWPGKEKDYNANYQYPSGNIDAEISYFLTQAMDASKKVADAVPLVNNTGTVQQSQTDPVNPYMNMFGDTDLSGYSEVMLWRQYSQGLGITHCVVVGAQFGDYGVGVTRGMVDGFLMKDGLPIYASSLYKGDKTISDVRTDRDSRLSIFLKEPGQLNILYPSNEGTHSVPVEPKPDILAASNEKTYSTGYALRKGGSFYANQCANGTNYTASIAFRAVEAYLNYIEACYEKDGTLDAAAKAYWAEIRNRAKVDPDYNKTISATDVSKEALNDWGAYSAGKLIDPTLYNIRRERRCEMMAEGLRYMDLRRWRAMDQMITTAYHIEGFNLWGGMDQLYKDADGKSQLVFGMDNDKSNVSDPILGTHYRPYEISKNSIVKDGCKWSMAHYLEPIGIQHMLITSAGGSDAKNSPIYQNPGWPYEANQGPTNL